MRGRGLVLMSGALLTVLAVSLGFGLPGLIAKPLARAGVSLEKPEAVIDLATDAGVRLVKGEWRYSDTKIISTEFRAPGADGQPTGAPIQTYDYTPHAGGADFDDSKWQAIGPGTLSQRRSTGRLCFNW